MDVEPRGYWHADNGTFTLGLALLGFAAGPVGLLNPQPVVEGGDVNTAGSKNQVVMHPREPERVGL
jgi:hypothetical protein